MIRILLILAFIFPVHIFPQSLLNMTVFGHVNPTTAPMNSGCFGYTDSLGREYALIGSYTGTFIYQIDDSANIFLCDTVPGNLSKWREIVVLGDYAYITTEGLGPELGMLILDLKPLPDSVRVLGYYKDEFTRAHIIQRDLYSDAPYIYVCGINSSGGVKILDVSDPEHPQLKAYYNPYYIHDVHVRGNRMYAAAIYDGFMDVLDISDKANPRLITQMIWLPSFQHSSFTTGDNHYLFTADEKDGYPGRVWDIRDTNNIVEVAQYTAHDSAILHNPYIRGDFAYVSHNTQGIRVVDMSRPEAPAEVGYCKMWTGAASGFHGLWSAWPFFPSGKIIGNNREDGLWIWRFNGVTAGRFYGTVKDSITGVPIPGAQIEIIETAAYTHSKTDGSYAFGGPPSGPAGYRLRATAPGYAPKTLAPILLASGDSLTADFLLSVGVGSDEPALKESITVFPNPAHDVVYLNSMEIIHGSVTVTDLAAGELLSKEMHVGPGLNGALDISGLSAGMYILQVLNRDGECASFAFEKN